jgi:hypothetical protein
MIIKNGKLRQIQKIGHLKPFYHILKNGNDVIGNPRFLSMFQKRGNCVVIGYDPLATDVCLKPLATERAFVTIVAGNTKKPCLTVW